MKKLDGIVIVKEMIVVDGHINDKGKVIAPLKPKFSAKPKRIAEDYVLNDPTAEIIGDAYEVFDLFEGRRRRRVVTKEEAEKTVNLIGDGKDLKSIPFAEISSVFISKDTSETITEETTIETKKVGRKPKVKEETESEKENFSENPE